MSKELIHNIFTSVTEQLVVMILENTCCNYTETTGYMCVRLIVIFLQKRFEICIYCKRYLKLEVKFVEFQDVLIRLPINNLLWLVTTANRQVFLPLDHLHI